MKLIKMTRLVAMLVLFAVLNSSFAQQENNKQQENSAQQDGSAQQEDSWYSITIDGVKSGWAHDTVVVDTETNNISIINVNTYVDSCLDTTIIKPNIVLPCEPANTYFTSQTSDLQFLDHNVQSHQ